MAGTYTVFNCGTSHTIDETYSTIPILYRDCTGDKFGNNGPVGLNALGGGGMGKARDDTVADILKKQPQTVNLTGHSRGGALCHMIANALFEYWYKGFKPEINIIVIDPVNMSSYTTGYKLSFKPHRYVAIVMENVTNVGLGLINMYPVANSGACTINMPGKHGSGTQVRTAIGWAVWKTTRWWLSAWGTEFWDDAPTSKEIAEAYAEIHVENPVVYSTRPQIRHKASLFGRMVYETSTPKDLGKVKERFVIDIDDNKEGYVGMGKRESGIGQMLATEGRTDFRNSPYFFNWFHCEHFKLAFPGLWKRFSGDFSSNSEVGGEVNEIEQKWPNIRKSFEQLGML